MDIVRFLIDRGADVDSTKGYSGWTALHLAAFWDHEETVRILIEQGATVDIISAVLLDDIARVGQLLDETPERRPAFLYTIGEGLDVTDHTRALENAEGIVRSFTLAGAREDGLFLRLAAGTRVQPVERGFRVDGKLTITVGGATAQVEAHGGKKTVLVPIAQDTSRLEVIYRW